MKIRASIALLAAAVSLAAASHAGAAAAPSLAPILAHHDWVRTPISHSDLAGKVVLVDVFTFGCYNCKNVTPNLRSLYKNDRADLAIVGVHTPETPYERDKSNVATNLAMQGIVWPVALDNDQALWNAYGVNAWPTQLIFDRHGVLRKTFVGDSQDAEVNAEIKTLIAES